MKTTAIIEGLTILQKYYNQDGFNVGAEHDVLHGYATDTPVDDDDLSRLIALGWFQLCEDDEEFTAEYYDPQESWTCYT